MPPCPSPSPRGFAWLPRITSVALILSCLSFFFGLTGCGPKAQPAATPPAEEAELTPAALSAVEAKAQLGPLLLPEFSGRRPNVLLVVFDDLNDYLLDHRQGVHMPHLRAFLDSATSFEHAYANVPACNPSRAAFLSGLSPERSGVVRNSAKIEDAPMLQHCLFLPEAFRAAGYATFTVGKIFHGKGIRPDNARFAAQWDIDERRLGRVPEPNPMPPIPSELQGGGSEVFWGAFPDAQFKHRDTAMAEAAAAYLGSRNHHPAGPAPFAYPPAASDDQRPFFAAVGFTLPHLPWLVPQSSLTPFPESPALPEVPDNDWDDLPKYARKHAVGPSPWLPLVADGLAPEALRYYLAACDLTDRNFGQLLSALDASPLAENTIVVVFSDHGFHLGEHHHFTKFHLWEQTLRVPFAIRLPGQRQGQKVETPVSLLDLYPTLRDLCGLAVPQHQLDGQSLCDLLAPATQPSNAQSASAAANHPAPLAWNEDGVSLATPRYRYTRWRDGGEELYDHQADPQEWINLAHPSHANPANQATLETLRRELSQRRQQLADPQD